MILISLFLLTGIPVWFETYNESPFIQADLRGEFPKRTAIESKLSANFGLVIQRSSSLSDSFYDEVKEHLRRSTIHAVVYQDTHNHFVACTPKGEPIDSSQTDIPSTLFQSLKVGEVAVLIEEPVYRNKRWSFSFSGHLVNRGEVAERRLGWFNVGPKVAAYQDIRFKFEQNEYIGEIGKVVGSTISIGTCDFTVADRHDSAPNGRNWVDITVSTMTPPVSYNFFNGIDLPKILEEIGPSFPFGLSSMGSYSRRKSDNLLSFRLDSEAPIDYWDKIRISKKTSISCYIRHLATEPSAH